MAVSGRRGKLCSRRAKEVEKMLGIAYPPGWEPVSATWSSTDWIVCGVVAFLLTAFAVYGFFVMRRASRRAAPRVERPAEFHTAA
jgi:hypothetical protein